MDLPKLKKVSEVKKKKILLFSDDLRMSSGVGTMSREIVMGTLDEFDWVQVGGAIKHPDKGKVIDMDKSAREETGVEDASLKVYPVDGYGDPKILRNLLEIEKPDAIMIYTDPRFWIWLFRNTKSDKIFQSFIITFGTIYLIQCGTNLIMKVVI